jgi:hypothetical protein
MAIRIGLKAKLYYGTAGTTAASELTKVRDVTLNLSAGVANTETRGSEIKSEIPTLLEASLSFELLYDDANAGVLAVEEAYYTRTPIAMLVLHKTGGNGLDADWNIKEFTRSEPLEGVITVSVTASPNNASREPARVEA